MFVFNNFAMSCSNRFIVLSCARSGSTYLMSLLQSNPAIKMQGELFNLSVLSSILLDLTVSDPKKYVEDSLSSEDQYVTSCGFKLFYGHATLQNFLGDVSALRFKDEAHPNLVKKMQNQSEYLLKRYSKKDLKKASKTLRKYLKRNTEFKIVHLMRRNKLKRLLSLKKAYVTDVWDSSQKTPEFYNKTIRLSYDECVQDFKKTKQYQKKYRSFFSKHEQLDIYYEDLAKDVENVMDTIQKFIGVQPVTLRSDLKKQGSMPLSKAIENYDELKAQFEGRPENVYFED